MDSQGTMYGPEEPRPADAVEVGKKAWGKLSDLNRRARRAFYAERRRGTPESDALTIAEDVHIGKR